MSKFNVGDLIYFKPGKGTPQGAVWSNPERAQWAGLDVNEHQEVVKTRGVLVQLKGDRAQVWHNEIRFESAEEWAKHQRPASPLMPATMTAPYGGAFAQARSKAFDDYREMRAKQGYSGISPAAFHGGFQAGFDHANKLSNATAFTAALSRATDPATSKAAAATAQAGKLTTLVLKALEQGPATAATLAERLGRPLNAVSPRMRPLINRNLVEVCGTRYDEGARSPRSLYRLVDHGLQAAFHGV